MKLKNFPEYIYENTHLQGKFGTLDFTHNVLTNVTEVSKVVELLGTKLINVMSKVKMFISDFSPKRFKSCFSH